MYTTRVRTGFIKITRAISLTAKPAAMFSGPLKRSTVTVCRRKYIMYILMGSQAANDFTVMLFFSLSLFLLRTIFFYGYIHRRLVYS